MHQIDCGGAPDRPTDAWGDAHRSAPVNLHEFADLARANLTRGAWDYFEGGSGDELTKHENQQAFSRIYLKPRVLVNVTRCELATTVLGTPISMPILIAPTAYHGLAHPDAEFATVDGANRAGALMVVSSNASRTLEDIRARASGPLWQQLYLDGEGEAALALVRRIEAAGYDAIVLTVDRPIFGLRERDQRNGFKLPAGVRAANFAGANRSLDAMCRATWSTLEWLVGNSTLPVVVKGILTGDDAARAVSCGVKGIIVSNHGGRQLDGVQPTIAALPEVVAAVGGRCDVLCDGGVRRGTDVLKALALGARAVLVGRPIVWGLAADGATGVARVLELLRAELERAMALCGRPTISSIDRSLVCFS